MTPETRIQLSLLERELAAATRPIVMRESTEYRDGTVLDWPRVSHPEIVRRWLGDDAVVRTEQQCCAVDGDRDCPSCELLGCKWPADCDGTLSDPEACWYVLASVRSLLNTGAMLPIDGSDEVVAEYCGRVFARVAG